MRPQWTRGHGGDRRPARAGSRGRPRPRSASCSPWAGASLSRRRVQRDHGRDADPIDLAPSRRVRRRRRRVAVGGFDNDGRRSRTCATASPHCDSDGAQAASDRELARVEVVPRHRMHRIHPSGASVARPRRSRGLDRRRDRFPSEHGSAGRPLTPPTWQFIGQVLGNTARPASGGVHSCRCVMVRVRETACFSAVRLPG
jgi:hypothetical protein